MKFRRKGKSFSIGDHPKLRAQQRFGWDFGKLKEQATKALEEDTMFGEFHLYKGKLFLFGKKKSGGTRLVTIMDLGEKTKGQYY